MTKTISILLAAILLIGCADAPTTNQKTEPPKPIVGMWEVKNMSPNVRYIRVYPQTFVAFATNEQVPCYVKVQNRIESIDKTRIRFARADVAPARYHMQGPNDAIFHYRKNVWIPFTRSKVSPASLELCN